MEKYIGLLAGLFSLPIFVMIFLKRKNLRKIIFKMLLMWIAIGIATIFLYFKNYGKLPKLFGNLIVGIEELLFGFVIVLIAGISIFIYYILFKKKLEKKRKIIKKK